MPTYTYKCKECNITVDQIRSIKDESRVLCGECGNPMDRIITTCNYVLKGGGWTGRDIKEKKERIQRSDKMGEKIKEKEQYNQFI